MSRSDFKTSPPSPLHPPKPLWGQPPSGVCFVGGLENFSKPDEGAMAALLPPGGGSNKQHNNIVCCVACCCSLRGLSRGLFHHNAPCFASGCPHKKQSPLRGDDVKTLWGRPCPPRGFRVSTFRLRRKETPEGVAFGIATLI